MPKWMDKVVGGEPEKPPPTSEEEAIAKDGPGLPPVISGENPEDKVEETKHAPELEPGATAPASEATGIAATVAGEVKEVGGAVEGAVEGVAEKVGGQSWGPWRAPWRESRRRYEGSRGGREGT